MATKDSVQKKKTKGKDAPSVKEGAANSPKKWLARIAKTKRVRTSNLSDWVDNVDYRRGKPFRRNDDSDRINVNVDWALTKNKHAQLYSQTPQVYLTAKNKKYETAIPSFGKQLNDTLNEACVGNAMDEAILDTINASGFGVVLVGYQKFTEDVDVPESLSGGQPSAADIIPGIKTSGAAGPMSPQPAMPMPGVGAPTPPPALPMPGVPPTPTPGAPPAMPGTAPAPPPAMVQMPRPVSERHFINRFSPSDFLWPVEFTGSNFDDADWLGRSGKAMWAEALQMFEGLKEEDKEKVLNASRTKNLRDAEHDDQQEPVVEYDEIFYWAYRFDPEEKQVKKIMHMVFVKGLKEPVVNEPWKGQKLDPQTKKYIGSCKFPIRVLTLTYISDDAIPPSDSAIGRPQVDEMMRSRSQIVMNRDRSQPMRWANVDRVDPMVLDNIMRGEYQTIIPLQGDGSKAIGEVARASYPPESFEFDQIIERDLDNQWGMGPNQQQAPTKGRRSAAETNATTQSFQTRIGYERARVASFLVGIAEVVAGHLALFGDFPILGVEEIQKNDQTWDRTHIANDMVFWIRPDSTVLLDANQRIDKLMKVLNLVGKSGFVNPKPIISEIIELHGLDPADVIVDPKPPKPPDPNLSMRLSGIEDLTNPIVLAWMVKTYQITPEEIDAAKKIMVSVGTPASGPPPEPKTGGPGGPAGSHPPGAQPPGGGGPPHVPGAPVAHPLPMAQPHPSAQHPDWHGMPKVVKREQDV